MKIILIFKLSLSVSNNVIFLYSEQSLVMKLVFLMYTKLKYRCHTFIKRTFHAVISQTGG